MGVIPQADGLMMPRISTNKATSLVSVNYSCDYYSHRCEKMVGDTTVVDDLQELTDTIGGRQQGKT